ncbi:MAG: hypothetical protein K8S00_10490 [Bacteroidales bacterium]|nr:hypothetical protein [Bacteroidales bacterium]
MKLTNNYPEIFEAFNNLKVVIIGDVMVDTYLWGRVERISPEAPVPIVAVDKRSNRLGGAANVALNIKALGATPFLCSVIGKDLKGEEFLSLLTDQDMASEGIFQSPDRITTTKFRIIGNNTQMLRVDEEVESDLNQNENSILLDNIENILASETPDVIIFQDYDKGVITASLISEVIKKASKANIPIVVDPKKKNFSHYRDLTLFKPNLKELKEGLNIDINLSEKDKAIKAIKQLMQDRNFDIVMTTLSEEGIIICAREDNKDIVTHAIPAHVRSVSDVSGAGDTVISVASLCLALKLTAYEIAAISNLAGGLVCEEVGVVSVDKQRLLEEVMNC